MPDESQARENIDRLLKAAGWDVVGASQANIIGTRGVAIREFPLKQGHGFADYLLYVDSKAAGVIEAKKQGVTLTGVETQSAKYTKGLPDGLPCWHNPLPFSYQSTGIENRFTNGLDPEPRSRAVFAFHRPETLADWLGSAKDLAQLSGADYQGRGGTFLERLKHIPPLADDLWPPKPQAIANIERSLRENRPRALVQMATGSGKTLLAIVLAYRLLKFAGARRILFLVDRGNLGRQTKKEFDQYLSPYNNFKFGEEYIVQHLTSNTLDKTARVCIATIQRMYSMLKGRELSEEDEEASASGIDRLFKAVEPIDYNPAIPIETFDIIVTDEAHRSIYNLWRQVLEYFDAYLIGLTATPSKQTFGFFNQNLVMEYGHEQAVADGVNVNYDVYRIRTAVTEAGGKVEAGYHIDLRDRATRSVRWEKLDEDFAYDPNQLDRDVVAVDQIRTLVRTFRDKLPTEIFPGRTEVPKTLIFAKDDSHAEDIVKIVREEFAKGNEFAQKITYRTTGETPERLIAAFRNSYHPRIAVTVDMIATGTDIKPLEIVMFMRAVKSRTFFEQMKGRGVRVISPDDLKGVTPDAKAKDHFVIVDCVGVCERDMTDSRPMDQKKSFSLEKLLQAVALGNTEPEVLSSVAARLARLEKDLPEADKTRIAQAAGGATLKDLARGIVNALSPDLPPGQTATAAQAAVKPLYDPKLRELILNLKAKNEQIIDTVTQDAILEAGFSEAARERAKKLVTSFEQFIQQHRDEITALQILYNRPTRAPLKFEDLKTLADALQAPPHLWTESQLWQAYAALDKAKVKGTSAKRILTDLVSLVRYAMHQENELVPYPERVAANFKAWLAQQQAVGKTFTADKIKWLEMIRDHIAANLGIEIDDFEYAPFNREGGIGKVHQLFGPDLPRVLEALNKELAA
ncbi:MAG: type I restriction-modification enzyme R subunit C-terminal domain-containing protein [Burkholderiales bacterium]